MEMNKRGMFFTLMAMGLISLMLVGFLGSYDLMNVKDKDVVEARFSILHTHKKNVEKYAENVLYVQTKHAIADMIRYINTNPNTGIDDTNKRFAELVTNATLYSLTSEAPNMNEIGINNWTGTMDKKSTQFLGLKSNMSITNPRLTQEEPWEIIAKADVILNASFHNISYNSKRTINTSFSILGYEDPLYLYNDSSNQINTTSHYYFNLSNTHDMLINRTYRHVGLGPNFVMRLEENYSNSSCCGIQSLINTSLVTSPEDHNKSFVDYLFWSGKRSCTNGEKPLYNFTNLNTMPQADYFKLDGLYMNIYGMNLSDTPGVPYCSP